VGLQQSFTGCEPGGMLPWIKCLNANSKNITPNILLQDNKKKTRDDNEACLGSSSSLTIQEKK
jgi:hypothetical protein